MFDLEATVIDSWNSGTPLPQKNINIHIGIIWSQNTLPPKAKRNGGNYKADIPKWEIVNFYGKGLMFDLWTRQFPDVDFILFDDVLPDKDSTTIRDSQMVRKISV